MAIKGIDVSYWQGKITVAAYKKAKASGVNFVIARLGYNASLNKDSTFENNFENAKAAGLDVGVYYYSTATTVAQAKAEANFCLKHLAGRAVKYPVFIDMEEATVAAKCNKATLTAIAHEFCDTIKAGGYKAGVYANLNWLRNKLGDLSGLDVWVAQYNSECTYTGEKVMWQYSSKGSVPGLNGNIDMNWCYKDYGSVPTLSSTKKSVETIAREVIAGKWGTGNKRKALLESAGYNYDEVQAKVNSLLGVVKLPKYTVGKTYTLQDEMKVRKGPGTNYGAKTYSQLTADGKRHDGDKDGALNKGTQVTCLETKTVGSNVWLRCPSGWIAAYYKGTQYIK